MNGLEANGMLILRVHQPVVRLERIKDVNGNTWHVRALQIDRGVTTIRAAPSPMTRTMPNGGPIPNSAWASGVEFLVEVEATECPLDSGKTT